MTAVIQQNVYSTLAAHKELSGIAFEKGAFHKIALDILEGRKWFAEHPSSIQYLTPKARQYTQIFDLAKESPIGETLKKLRAAHIHFTNAFIEEFERVCPEHPDVVNVKYKQTIRLFRDIIQKHFDAETIAAKDVMIFAKTPMLAIEELRNHPERTIPEIFNPDEIGALREDLDRPVLLSKAVRSLPKSIMNAIFREALHSL